MGQEIPLEIRWQAEELYIVNGLTYEQVADATGASVSTIKRWAEADPDREVLSWPERRDEYRREMASINRNSVILRGRMIAKAMQSLDPQDVYAVAALEKITAKAVEAAGSPAPQLDPVDISDPADAVDALDEVIGRKLAAMLNDPGKADLGNIRRIKDSMELVEKMRRKLTADDKKAGKGGLSDADADTIRREILGVKDM